MVDARKRMNNRLFTGAVVILLSMSGLASAITRTTTIYVGGMSLGLSRELN